MTMQAQRGGGGIAPTHPQPGCREKWVVSPTLQSSYPPGNTCYPLYRRMGGPWGGGRSAERPARSESLYRLRTPGHLRAVVALTAWFYLFCLSSRLSLWMRSMYAFVQSLGLACLVCSCLPISRATLIGVYRPLIHSVLHFVHEF